MLGWFSDARILASRSKRHPFRVAGEDFGQDLDGDSAGQCRVLGVIDDPHATAADLIDNPVLPGDKTPFR